MQKARALAAVSLALLAAPALAFAMAAPALAQMDMSLLPDEPAISSAPPIDLSVSEEPSSSLPDNRISNSAQPSSAEPSSFVPSSEPEADISNEGLPPPVTPTEAFQAFFDACTSLSGGDPDAYDKANDAGWVPYDGADYGPYKRVYTGSRDFEGLGIVEIWGSLETYPTQTLGYCRVDFADPDGTFGLSEITGLNGLTGTVGENGLNGVWETADKKLLVIAANYEGTVAIEFNVLVGDTPAP